MTLSLHCYLYAKWKVSQGVHCTSPDKSHARRCCIFSRGLAILLYCRVLPNCALPSISSGSIIARTHTRHTMVRTIELSQSMIGGTRGVSLCLRAPGGSMTTSKCPVVYE